jgi:hypothetical protein
MGKGNTYNNLKGEGNVVKCILKILGFLDKT